MGGLGGEAFTNRHSWFQALNLPDPDEAEASDGGSSHVSPNDSDAEERQRGGRRHSNRRKTLVHGSNNSSIDKGNLLQVRTKYHFLFEMQPFFR